MKDPLRSRGVVSEPRPVKEVVKAMRRQIGRFDEDRQNLFRENSRLTAERDEARANFGRALAAGAKAEQERDAALARAMTEGQMTACAEAYQAVGRMADALGIFEHEQVQNLLTNLDAMAGGEAPPHRDEPALDVPNVCARVAELEEGLGQILALVCPVPLAATEFEVERIARALLPPPPEEGT
ncbi:hypothetical protein [Roseococcus pinisoli]|uniref:Uncharacterized protein n=1 Tax=Roseococcus pinisoli TaxID=2835040 RepID=A0ABS5QCG4_9PROT|nr:hypothetical protein [Roseococcus pinisoli]MBS7811198.1 hypothetical protein [Roseococcus pinisoli]